MVDHNDTITVAVSTFRCHQGRDQGSSLAANKVCLMFIAILIGFCAPFAGKDRLRRRFSTVTQHEAHTPEPLSFSLPMERTFPSCLR